MFRKMILGFILICLPFNAVWALEINFSDASVADVVSALAKQAGIDLIMSSDSNSQKRASVYLKDATAEEAMEYILRANGFTYEKKGNVKIGRASCRERVSFGV